MALISWKDERWAAAAAKAAVAADAGVRAVAAHLVARIMLNAPVDTGFLRASTHMHPDGSRGRAVAVAEATAKATVRGVHREFAEEIELPPPDVNRPTAIVGIAANYTPYVEARTDYVSEAVEETKAIAAEVFREASQKVLQS